MPSHGNIFCFSREESEKIYSCLKSEDTYNDYLKNRAPYKGEEEFWDSDLGKLSLVILSFSVGYTAKSLIK